MSDFTGSGKPFDDGYLGLDPRLESRRYSDSFRADYSEDHFATGDEHNKDDGYDMVSDAPIFEQSAFHDNGFNTEDHHGVHLDSPSPFDESFNSEQEHHPEFTPRGGEFSPVSEVNGHEGYEFMEPQQPDVFGSGTGSVLPPLEEMEPEEGFLLREWKRQNAERLAEKEQQEKERLMLIMEDADAIKEEYKNKRLAHCEAQKNNNRDKEKVFLANQTHFHETADKHYWKAVSELIPTEVPSIESKRKEKEKKVAVLFNQGPKPGKATDLSRMRQVLLKLKHNPPDHMKTAPPPPPPPPKAEGDKAASGDKAAQPVSSTPAVEVAA